MADTEIKNSPETIAPAEKTFRKKNQWHSFMGNLYGALGGAAFIGLLGTLANSIVKVAAGVAGEGAIFGITPMLVMAGLMAAGTICIWLSQREYTELKCIGDEHLAHQMQNNKAPQQAVEHSQNCRKDSKKWTQAIQTTGPAECLRG